MLISELIERLEYIKRIGGDLPCLFFTSDFLEEIKPCDVIAATNNGSNCFKDGVYFNVPDNYDRDKNCEGE